MRPATTQLRTLSVMSILFLTLPPHLIAQDGVHERVAASSLSVELDPAPFLLKGYSFSLRYANKALPHWSVMTSVYAADFPDRMMSTGNRDAGWSDLHFAASNALFVDYTLREDGRGLFVGPSVFFYDNRVAHAESGTALAFRSIYPNIRFGYTWFPFRKAGLYLAPWLNLGSEVALDPTQVSDGPAYTVAGFKYIAAVHLGYRLGL